MQTETTDINGVKIEPGDMVKRWPIIGKKEGDHRIMTVKSIGPMHGGGETMILFEEGGGAHHPKACEIFAKVTEIDHRPEHQRNDIASQNARKIAEAVIKLGVTDFIIALNSKSKGKDYSCVVCGDMVKVTEMYNQTGQQINTLIKNNQIF